MKFQSASLSQMLFVVSTALCLRFLMLGWVVRVFPTPMHEFVLAYFTSRLRASRDCRSCCQTLSLTLFDGVLPPDTPRDVVQNQRAPFAQFSDAISLGAYTSGDISFGLSLARRTTGCQAAPDELGRLRDTRSRRGSGLSFESSLAFKSSRSRGKSGRRHDSSAAFGRT